MNIIACLILIGLVVVLFKAVLFWPRGNSAISIIFILSFIHGSQNILKSFMLVIALIDCVVDWIMAPKLYEDFYFEDSMDELDKFYIIKSLLSTFTGFYARVVYLLVVDPIMYMRAKNNVNDMLENDLIIPNNDIITKYSKQNQGCMYVILDKYIKQGLVITNKEEVKEELKYSKAKLENSYPTKLIDKLIKLLNDNKEIKKEREKAEAEIKSENKLYSYIECQFYQRCKQEFASVLVSHGTLSPVDIIKLEDLQSMVFLNGKEFTDKEVTLKYYAISILNGLEKDGIVEKYDFGDGLLENHQYKHTNGLPMKSINADENPLLALDDD
jgi:hypothetical protein